MIRVRVYRVQVSVDGATWSTIYSYFDRPSAEHDAQALLFSYRRINKNAKTRVHPDVDSIMQEQYDQSVRDGVTPQKI